MQAGSRDRLITIMNRVVTQDPIYGSEIVTWEPLAQEWAQVRDVLPSRAESVADGVNLSRRPCRIRMPYRSDVTSAMRVEFEGRSLRIIAGPAEMGRRKQIEIVAEELSTEGQD